MQIKIEIDVKPEELRRFLGLPDVAGLQDDVVQFLREKVGQVNESFNPTEFVKGNLETLKQSPAFKKLMTRINLAAGDVPSDEGQRSTRRNHRRTTRKKSGTNPD